MFRQEQEVAGEAMPGEAAGADQLDLEAAEQLIQLSGGDGDGGSESRSVDSVKCLAEDPAGRKEKDAAVESRLRRSPGRFVVAGKDGGDGDEHERRSAGNVNKSKADGTKEGGKEEEEPAVESRRRSAAARFLGGGEERRRPKFRWLADIYRGTRPVTTRDLRVAGGNIPPEANDDDERRRKRKRAAEAGDVEVFVPMVVSGESKKITVVAWVPDYHACHVE